ncbi:alpha/beta fold hydrolase [Streptomyces sp. NBC_00989]|uniref:alpha/beta fold hydrolase n=1 Tax=Streptomyces sp. NBC_00989 TaxID=2903705 RepID=UPI003869962D|nr:alpha/beta hydrolase [Streptomyces sp. NBC_00989]
MTGTVFRDHTVELSRAGAFHYREAGDPDAPPVVLLHGLMYDARDWDEVARFLAGHFHVLALTQRGHGASVWPGTYSFELGGADLEAFADALGLDRFTLIGHSMGARVGCVSAEGRPERVERMVWEDTAPIDVDFPESSGEVPGASSFDLAAATALVHQIHHPDPAWWNDLPKITAPTLIIGGGASSYTPQEGLAEAARRLPAGRLVTIEGAGHLIHRSRPREYEEALRRFLLPDSSDGFF